jgi:polar amino acid transport system substrate-binding protein
MTTPPPRILLIALGFALLALAGCTDDRPTLERLREDGVVRIAYANERPYGYLETETGRVTGEAPEIARVIFDRLGVTKVEPVVVSFQELIPGLKAGRFDVVAAGMYITPERAREITFSNPTYVIGEGFVVRRSNPLDLHSYEDVAKHETARIGVMAGSVEHGYAEDLGIPEDRIVVYPDYATALVGLRSDRVEAVAATSLTVTDLLTKDEDNEFERADPFTDPVIDGEVKRGYGAFGFRTDDSDLLDAFNRELAEFIGSDEHRELVRPFGFREVNLPGDVTAEQLVSGD